MRRKQKKAGCLNASLGCLGFSVLGVFGFVSCVGYLQNWSVEHERKQAVYQQTLNKTIPLGTKERMIKNVKDALGESNRNIARVGIESNSGVISLDIAADDNLTEGFIKRGARSDVLKALKAIKASQYDFHSVRFSVSFPLVDKFGNSQESIVARGTYFRDTVDRINFENILTEDAFTVADDVTLHPTMKY